MMETEEKFLFPTNRRNLLSIISSGVIGPSEIFAKYNVDILNISKGYVPLFKDGIDDEIIDLTTNNRETNFPVLIELNKEMISEESCKDLGIGSLKLCSYVLSFDKVKAVHFVSIEDKDDFLSRGFDNVPMENYEFKVSPELFETPTTFSTSVFDSINEHYDDKDILRRQSLIADKVVASIALLSKNMMNSDDAIFLRALIEFNKIPEELTVSPSYDLLVDLINSIIIEKRVLSTDDSENIKLMGILLNILIDMNPSDGWNPSDILERLHNEYLELSGKEEKSISSWYTFCRAILKNEQEINPEIFTDERDTVKRSIFLFLLRPEYQDIIDSANSYLNPGHIVRTLALFLSGFWSGYERLYNGFKTPKRYHEIFSILKSYIINKNLGNELDEVIVSTGTDMSYDVSQDDYLCKFYVAQKKLVEQSIKVPENVDLILSKMEEKNYEQTKYSVLEGRISYSFEYPESKRKQPIYIDVERHTIRISSPCVEFTKYKSYEKKYATQKVLSQMMKENGKLKGKAYFVYDEGINISLERRVAISNIKNVDIIEIIEFVARTADDFEEIFFNQDKVQ